MKPQSEHLRTETQEWRCLHNLDIEHGGRR
jgi:hypothetical protein